MALLLLLSAPPSIPLCDSFPYLLGLENLKDPKELCSRNSLFFPNPKLARFPLTQQRCELSRTLSSLGDLEFGPSPPSPADTHNHL